MATLEAAIERKVAESVAHHVKPNLPDEDEEMQAVPDKRMVDLEQQVKSLQENMQIMATEMHTTHQNQQQHNAQVAGQITAVKHQIDAQQTNLQHMLDRSMEHQMSRIEALLEKRSRLGE